MRMPHLTPEQKAKYRADCEAKAAEVRGWAALESNRDRGVYLLALARALETQTLLDVPWVPPDPEPITWKRPDGRPDYVTHEMMPDGSVHPFPFPIRVF